MQHIFGIFLRGSDIEIIDDEDPLKNSFAGLYMAMIDGRKRMMENPNIRQINIYQVIQGQRILSQQMFSEVESVKS